MIYYESFIRREKSEERRRKTLTRTSRLLSSLRVSYPIDRSHSNASLSSMSDFEDYEVTVRVPLLPTSIVLKISPSGTWTTDICGCTSNCCNLCMVMWCPCVTYGQIAHRVGSNGCCDNCGCCCNGCLFLLFKGSMLSCCATYLLRRKVAEKMGIQSNCCSDTICSICCEPCVMCQMANHLDIQKDSCSFSAPPVLESIQR